MTDETITSEHPHYPGVYLTGPCAPGAPCDVCGTPAVVMVTVTAEACLNVCEMHVFGDNGVTSP